MILDKKLQLASNMSIGTATRDFAGCKTSTDKISISFLRDFGRGEQAYLCVTVKTDFTVSAVSSFGLSLCAEHIIDTATIASVGATQPATALLYHRIQPRLAFSGYIPGNIDSNTKNAVAGKRFLLPISMLSHYSTYVFNGTYKAIGNAYFMFEELDATDPTFAPASNITAGSIDVDIVTLAEAGAGPGFNDQMCYPTSIKVQ